MHRKFSSQGLAVVTVSVDPPEEKAMVKEAADFLREKNAPFVNLHLNEPEKFWQDKLGFSLPPCYFVFDREGKWVRIAGSDYSNEEMIAKLDETVEKLLKAK